MSIEPLSAFVGVITGTIPAIGAIVYARNQWRASNRSDSEQERQERMDHQGCLEQLSNHVAKSAERFAEYDEKIEAIHAQHRECTRTLARLEGEIHSIRKTFSPPPFPKVTP
jgi:chromosome segregation ATPase